MTNNSSGNSIIYAIFKISLDFNIFKEKKNKIKNLIFYLFYIILIYIIKKNCKIIMKIIMNVMFVP